MPDAFICVAAGLMSFCSGRGGRRETVSLLQRVTATLTEYVRGMLLSCIGTLGDYRRNCRVDQSHEFGLTHSRSSVISSDVSSSSSSGSSHPIVAAGQMGRHAAEAVSQSVGRPFALPPNPGDKLFTNDYFTIKPLT